MYAYDITNDVYYISKKALDRFALPSNLFHDVVEAHNVFVYADDIKILSEDLKKMLRGEKESHNIKYRWIGKNGQPIWINCKGCIYVLGEKKETFLLGCINEIGARQAADNVSNLLGEEAFKEQVQQLQEVDKKGYVLRIGIDDIKDINERFGIEYGDYILRVLGRPDEGSGTSGTDGIPDARGRVYSGSMPQAGRRRTQWGLQRLCRADRCGDRKGSL